MSDPLDWHIPPGEEDWQCGWESSRRFQITYWASLPLREQIMAIEEMERLGELFARQAPVKSKPREKESA